jgi:ParB family chromosome partitioning protein
MTEPLNKENVMRVPIDSIEPNDWNPNQMPSHLFNELSHDIEEEGMDQPVVVIERDGKRIIVDGEHRYRASKAAGRTDILISVRDYSDDEAKIRTVRRNMIHGTTDPAKFTKLVMDLNNRGLPIDEIKRRMATPDKEFMKMYQGNTADKSKKAAEVIADAEKGVAQTFLVVNLSQMIRDIVAKFGETIQQGFIAFSYKGQTHMLISMDPKLHKAMVAFKSAAEEDKLTQEQISERLANALMKAS